MLAMRRWSFVNVDVWQSKNNESVMSLFWPGLWFNLSLICTLRSLTAWYLGGIAKWSAKRCEISHLTAKSLKLIVDYLMCVPLIVFNRLIFKKLLGLINYLFSHCSQKGISCDPMWRFINYHSPAGRGSEVSRGGRFGEAHVWTGFG